MNWTDFHFIRPYWLLMLIPFLALLIFLVRRKLTQGNWSSVCDPGLLPYLLQDKAIKQSRWPLISGAFAAFLTIIAMAGPAWQRLPTPVFRNDSALVIALDLSGSMNAADLKPNRLTLARYKITDILKRRKDGQTALLVFAGDAFTVTPLTNDTQTIDSQLSALSTGIMPNDGDNIGLALKQAADLLKQAGLQKGQILLISDGGDIDEGIGEAKNLGAYQLQVIGAGTAEGAPIALESGGFRKDAQGGIMVSKMDSAGLEKLAHAGNGAYHILTPDDSDINALLSTVSNRLEQQGEQKDDLMLEQWNDNGPWLLLLVLPLAALLFRKGLLAISLLALIPFPNDSYAQEWQWRDLWQNKDQQAQEAYQQGDYQKASGLFKNTEWKAAADYKAGAYDKAIESLKNSSSANSHYNQGNALAQSGHLQEALAAYNQALKINPNDEDAKYNKEVVEKALKQQEKNQQNQDKKDNSKDDKNGDKQDDAKGDNQQNNQQDAQENNNQDGGKEDKSSKQSEEQSKPEQKPERKAEDMPEKPKEEQKNQQPEQARPEQTEQKPAEQNDDKKNAANTEPLNQESKEQQQANEQWLNRIPDDPAGLLRRKFRYQYDRRNRQQ